MPGMAAERRGQSLAPVLEARLGVAHVEELDPSARAPARLDRPPGAPAVVEPSPSE